MDFANETAEGILHSNINKCWKQKSTGCAPYSTFGQPGFYCEYSDICDADDWEDMARFYKKEKPFHPFKVDR